VADNGSCRDGVVSTDSKEAEMKQTIVYGALLALSVVLCRPTIGAAAPVSISQFGDCAPISTAVFSGKNNLAPRIDVQCSAAAPGTSITYFAVSTKGKNGADLYLSMFEAAVVNGKHLFIFYETDPGKGPKIGCRAADCRLIQGARIY
jgi:hypothetical protein